MTVHGDVVGPSRAERFGAAERRIGRVTKVLDELIEIPGTSVKVGVDPVIGLIPFAVSSLTVAVNPVKLYEYLAAGLPVAATPLPELAQFGDVCYPGASGDAFVRAVELAVSEASDDPRRAERRALARRHTWSQRAADFAALLAE